MNLRTFYTTLSLLALVVTWTYWNTLTKAHERWLSDVQYSHGWLIPAFAIFLLYHRRDMIAVREKVSKVTEPVNLALQPSWWCLPFLAVALILRWVEAIFYFNGLDLVSLVFMTMGLVVALGGLYALRWAWPACLFLIFMMPLPYVLHTYMSTRLQVIATDMSVFALQTFGVPAVAEGTLIKVNEAEISVADACSGLGMIMTFVALSTAAVMLIKSPWWVKAGLLLGAIPISLICNMVRISVVAGYRHLGHTKEEAEVVHDIMGWGMIILGCCIIFVELYILDRIVVVQDNSRGDREPMLFPFAVQT